MRRWFRALILVMALGAFSGWAQVPDYQLVPEALVKDFQEGLKLIKGGQYERGFEFLDQALVEFWTYQIQDLPVYSLALIRTAEEINLPPKILERILNYSDYFAPHSSEVCFARARLFLSRDHFSLSEAVSELGAGFDLLEFDLLTKLRLKALLWMGIACFLRLALLIFALFTMGKYFRVGWHFYQHLWTKDFSKLALPVLLLVCLIPIFLGAPLWMVLIWPAILFLPFSRAHHKGVFMVLLFCFCFSDLLEQRGKDSLISLNQSSILAELRLGAGIAKSDDLIILREKSQGAHSPGVVLALAEAERRAGEFKRSSEILINLVENPDSGESRESEDQAKVSSLAYTQLGALYLDFNQFEPAVKALENALALAPNWVEVYYNLSQAYAQLNKFAQSDNAYTKATQLNPKAVSRFDFAKKLSGVEFISLRIPTPASILEKEVIPKRDHFSVLKAGKAKWGFFFLAFFLMLIGLRNQTRICAYCGKVICPKCLPESRSYGVCGPCYQVYLSGKPVDPKLKMDQRSMVQRYQKLTGWMGLALNLLMPGSGLVLKEKTFTGFILLLLPLVFLTSLELGWRVPSALTPGFNFFSVWAWLGGGVYLIMGLISILIYLKWISPEG